MNRTFDPHAHVEHVGSNLVTSFENARGATTASLTSGAMERPVRDALEQILPRGIAAESGCVIDSQGRTSRQIDVVLYERDFCPVYRINDNPETTYYPCEGVIAVGEVKSRVGMQEFDDAVVKMASVKVLERQFERLPSSSGHGYGAPHRGYGGTDGPVFASFDPESDSRGDIVGFLLTDALTVEWETAMEYYRERTPQFPDLLIPLTGPAFASAAPDRKGRLAFEPMRTAPSVCCIDTANPFGYLLLVLQQRFRAGKTAPLRAFESYLVRESHWHVLKSC